VTVFHTLLCRVVRGGNNLCDGPVDDDSALAKAMARVQERGFGHQPEAGAAGAAKKARIEGAQGPGQVTACCVTAYVYIYMLQML
jgi:hypothetical protein